MGLTAEVILDSGAQQAAAVSPRSTAHSPSCVSAWRLASWELGFIGMQATSWIAIRCFFLQPSGEQEMCHIKSASSARNYWRSSGGAPGLCNLESFDHERHRARCTIWTSGRLGLDELPECVNTAARRARRPTSMVPAILIRAYPQPR